MSAWSLGEASTLPLPEMWIVACFAASSPSLAVA